MGTAKAYLFRVFSHSHTSYSISEEYKYEIPDDVKRRAVTAGLIGGILFFIVAIILSVCTVKICNKKRRRKQERGKNNAVANPSHQPPCIGSVRLLLAENMFVNSLQNPHRVLDVH